MAIKAILFDLDGTLTDTIDIWHKTLNDVLAYAGMGKIERNAYEKKYWGMDSRTKLKVILKIDGEKLEEMYNYFNERLVENFAETETFEGVDKTIKELSKTLKLAVVSNSSMDVVEAQLKATKLIQFFDALVADAEPKPSPDGINAALGALGVSKDDAVFVGDSQYDLQAGKTAQIKTLIVRKDITNLRELLDKIQTL